MKKFILLTIFCSSFLFAQDPAGIGILTKDNWINAGGGSYKYFWTPTFVDTTWNQTANTMLIDYNAVRGDTLKTVGGKRLNFEYVRVWLDSTFNVLVGGDFSNMDYWVANTGFTLDGSDASCDGSQSTSTTINYQTSTYPINYLQDFILSDSIKYSFDVTGYSAGEIIAIQIGKVSVSLSVLANGTYSGVIFKNITPITFPIIIPPSVTLTVDADFVGNIDNINIFTFADSVAGSQYTINITEANDSTWYYHDYLVGWKQKDKDTIWYRTAADSLFIPDYYEAPVEENGLYTSDGNELYTSDGNKLYAKQEEG